MDKEIAVEQAAKILKSKQDLLHQQIVELEQALITESKSTAGDKHETGRAMMQLERERLGNQLKALELQITHFQNIDFKKTYLNVHVGALVQTEDGYYLLGVSIGQISAITKPLYGISVQSPMGKLLLGKKVNEQILFNNKTISILTLR